MAKIIPKLNLNRTPQAVDDNSLVFAKDIMLNKDNTFSRDKIMLEVANSNVANTSLQIVGTISDNNAFYVFYANSDNSDGCIYKYDESAKTYTLVNCAWSYSGGEIDGKVINSLNGDTLLVIAEKLENGNVPLKTINLTTATSNDDESIYTQAPKIPIVNLFDKGTYSCNIPKGVYQFFIRYEIYKDYYTGWMPCSRELVASNAVIKNIVQGTIRYVDENTDANESFILEPNLINDNGTNYSRFQLGFVISTNDAVQCRTWKHFDKSYITNKTPIYFSYNKTDIEEYNIDEMLKAIYNLYNVGNITTFKNKVYISNYKETNFNPDLNIGDVTFEYKYNEETAWEQVDYQTRTYITTDGVPENPNSTTITTDDDIEIKTVVYNSIAWPIIPYYGDEIDTSTGYHKAINSTPTLAYDFNDFLKELLTSDSRIIDSSSYLAPYWSSDSNKYWYSTKTGFNTTTSKFSIYRYKQGDIVLYSLLYDDQISIQNNVSVEIGFVDATSRIISAPNYNPNAYEGVDDELPEYESRYHGKNVTDELSNDLKVSLYSYIHDNILGDNYNINGNPGYIRGELFIDSATGKIVNQNGDELKYIKILFSIPDGSGLGAGQTHMKMCLNLDFYNSDENKSRIEITPANTIGNRTYIYSENELSIPINEFITTYNRTIVTDNRTLMPNTKYAFYVHYITENGEITNGYKIGDDITDNFLPDSNHCYPVFSNITIPNGYTAAFISYAKIENKFVDCRLSKQRIDNTEDETTETLVDICHKYKYEDSVKKYVSSTILLDCPEIDTSLYAKYDNIKVHYSFTCDGIDYSGTVEGKYYFSSSYDSSQPYLFGATGKIGITIELPDIVDDSNLSTDLTDANFYILDEFEIAEDNIALKKFTPYFDETNNIFNYNQFNSPGYICGIYKPNNKEFLYFFTGTDIYTKSSDGDLKQYKGRYEVTTSNYIEVLSEYNLLNVALSTNLITDITRGYYNLKDGAYSATVTSIDNTPEYYSGINDGMEDLESLEDTWFYNHWVIIPAITATSSMIGMDILCDANGNISEDAPCCRYVGNGYSEIYDVGGTKELFDDAETNIDIISHLSHEAFLGNVAPTESVQHATVTIDGQEIAIYKVTLYSKFQLSGAASSTTMVDTIYYRKLVGQDLDKEVTRVFRYIETTCAKTHDLKSYEQAENTKTTTYDGKFVITTTSKKTKKFSWNTDRVFIDANNKSIIPAPGSSNRCVCGYYYEDHTNVYVNGKADEYCPTAHTLSNSSGIDDYTYSYGLGILPILSNNVEVTSSSTSDVDENNAEYTAYQNYSYVESLNLSTIYKLPSMYYNYTTKVFLPYDANDNIIEFNNTIRSSNVISDESRTYGFEFGTNAYYNVPCSKGVIVNLLTIGNYILVHTKDSLFNFSGSNSLQTDNGQAQLKESDVFDTGIREVEGSEYGYCGIQKKSHACVTQAGYFFYDASVNSLYNYTGQSQINLISDSFDKFLRFFKPTDVAIANDYYNDRIIICLKTVVNNANKYETLSYNYRIKSLVSLHSYAFDKSFNTKTNVYCRLSEGANSGVFKLSEIGTNSTPQLVLHNHYFNIMNDANYDNKYILDVICNNNYEIVKTLNFINWISDMILPMDDDYSNFAEERILRRNHPDGIIYPNSLDSVLIYSDCCSTDTISAGISNNSDEMNNGAINNDFYEKPRYNNGIWTINYFRNVKTIIKNAYDVVISNEQSLMYGKYFVARFIFSNDFKFENITFNTSRQ